MVDSVGFRGFRAVLWGPRGFHGCLRGVPGDLSVPEEFQGFQDCFSGFLKTRMKPAKNSEALKTSLAEASLNTHVSDK